MSIEGELEDLDLGELVEISALEVDDMIDFARYNEVEVLGSIASSDFFEKLACVDENGNSLLHMAAANGHTASIQVLMTCTAVIKLLNSQNSEGNTPLHWAALNGQSEAVKVLLGAGADMTLENAFKRNAFDEAVEREKFEVTSVIIEFMEKNKKTEEAEESVVDIPADVVVESQ